MRITFIGQSSLLLEGHHGAILVDPYFFDTCAERHGPHLRRLKPPGVAVSGLPPLTAVLVTHEHDDHADAASVLAVARRFPGLPVHGPAPAVETVRGAGVIERPLVAGAGWQDLDRGIRFMATPAAHPNRERLSCGADRWCGYVIEIDGVRVWHAGDTSGHDDVIAAARAAYPLRCGFLPVNERSFQRERMGIIGNMSPREALQLADEVGLPEIVPIHWDLFECNGTSRGEVEAAHRACGSRANVRWMEPGDSIEVSGADS
jgi:L-ascorbate metabolism protein UlaG (beta-lactamase superfamily)